MLTNDLMVMCAALRVPANQGRIVAALMSQPFVKPLEIAELHGIDERHLRVLVHRLRPRLQSFGVKIYSRYGSGYYMDDESRARIRSRVDRFTEATAAL